MKTQKARDDGFPASGSRVVIGEKTVTKFYRDPVVAREELARSVAAVRLAHSTDCFDVPDVLDADETSITWHRIHGIRPLRVVLAENPDQELMWRVGQALAVVHSGLSVDPAIVKYAASPFDRDVVPIHGDFGLGNVQYVASEDRLVLLDWAGPHTLPWLEPSVTMASQHLDMAGLLISLFYQRVRDPELIRTPEKLFSRSLDGYASVRDPRVSGFPSVARHAYGSYWSLTRRRSRPLRVPYRLRMYAYLARLDRRDGPWIQGSADRYA